MSTLIEIPSVKIEHLPTASSEPLPLADRILSLTLLPPSATHPSETLTITVGSTSFPLSQATPVHKVHAAPIVHAHPTYVFSPAAAGTGAPIGQVRISMKTSTTEGEFQATEALCRVFETTLTSHKVLDASVLNSDTRGLTAHNWGESAASAAIGLATTIASKITSFTDNHVTTTTPLNTRKPPVEVVAGAYQANVKTAQFAEAASIKVNQMGTYVHEGGKKLGNILPESVAKSMQTHTPEQDKSDFRKVAETGWSQFTHAAKGLATAVGTVGVAVSENTHKAVEHGFGKEADKVAQDLGQAGANVAGVGLNAAQATGNTIRNDIPAGINAGIAGHPASLDNVKATNAVLEVQPPAGTHGKPVQVFSDEKQAKLLNTALE